MRDDKYDLDPNVFAFAKRAVEEGDEIAVYENHDLGHPELGRVVLLRIGPLRTFKTEADCPKTLPDGSAGIPFGWRYPLQEVIGKETFNERFVLDATEGKPQTHEEKADESIVKTLKEEDDRQWDEALDKLIDEFNPSAKNRKQDDPPEE